MHWPFVTAVPSVMVISAYVRGLSLSYSRPHQAGSLSACVLTLFSDKIISRMVAIRQPTTEFIGSAIV
jgi:hypothetical protein